MSRIEVSATFYTDEKQDENSIYRKWGTFLSTIQYTEAKLGAADYFVYEENGGLEPERWIGSGGTVRHSTALGDAK